MQRGAKIYAVVSQFVVEMIVLVAGGILLGKYVFHNEILGGILAAVGAILGIGLFMIYLYRIGDKLGRKEGKSNRRDSNTETGDVEIGGSIKEEPKSED